MSDNPLDRIPEYDRVSIRAVLVPEGVDPGPALAEAGIIDAVAVPAWLGKDQPDATFGDGITPNPTAILEHDQADASGLGSDGNRGDWDAAVDPRAGATSPSATGPSALTSPAANGFRSFAPGRQLRQSVETANPPPLRVAGSISSAATQAPIAPPSPAAGLRAGSQAMAASKAGADGPAAASPAAAPMPPGSAGLEGPPPKPASPAGKGATGLNGHGYQPRPNDAELLARAMFAESAGVPDAYAGIGWAIVDRVGDPAFRPTLDAVIHQPKQFDSVGKDLWNTAADPSSLNARNAASYARALAVAKGILAGKIADPTEGATYFYSGDKPSAFFQTAMNTGKLVKTRYVGWPFTLLREPKPNETK